MPYTYLGTKNPGERNRKCKGTEVGLFLENLRNSEAAAVTKAEQMRKVLTGNEVREVVRRQLR